MRVWFAGLLIRCGMALLPANVRKLVINVLMYHVPGALTEEEKTSVRMAKMEWDNGAMNAEWKNRSDAR